MGSEIYGKVSSRHTVFKKCEGNEAWLFANLAVTQQEPT